MADPWTEWYTGAMAPPMRTPGGGLVAAPNTLDPMSVEEMYEGIYGPANSGLKTRQVQSLPVTADNWDNPTRSPYQPMVAGRQERPGDLRGSSGPANEERVPALPPFDTGYMSGYTPQDSFRLLPNPGLPSPARDGAVAAINSAVPDMRGMPFNTGSRDSVAQRQSGLGFSPFSEPTHELNPLQDNDAQEIADSLGMPVRTSSGAVVRPSQAQTGTASQRAAQQRTPSLIEMLLGGGARNPVAGMMGGGGGMLGALLGGMGPSRLSAAPVVAAYQQQGMTPSQAYAAAAAPALNPNAGYTPSSSGQSNDWFSTVRGGGSY